MSTHSTVMVPSRTPAAPPVPQLAVTRANVIGRLDDGVRGRLTLVVAPPGFGKTVLLSQWTAGHAGSRVAWLSLDEGDNDATRLAVHLVNALNILEPALGHEVLERVERSGVAMGENFLDRLLDELTHTAEASLVLHNVDALTNPALVDELGVLIEQAPPQLNFVVARHSSWPSGLHGLRRSEGDTYLSQADLAFGHDDARTLLTRVAERDFSNTQVDKLVTRTEGWAAGLQLAAIKLRHEGDADRFIDGFHGDDRDVAGYLTSEVLAHQSPQVRAFLLDTAVLDQLSGPLCDAVTGAHDGSLMLDRLERDGLFIRRSAKSDGWFRYQQLFRDLLRHELRTSAPEREGGLLGRAADWHLSHGDLEQAAEYLIAATDWDRIVALVDEHGRTMFERGNASTLLRWFDAMPSAVRAERPDIDLRYATLHTMVGNSRRADELVGKLTTRSISTGEAAVIDALRTCWVQWHASPTSVVESADALLANLEVLPPDDIPDILGLTSPASLEALASVSRARGIWYQGDTAAGRRALAAIPHDAYLPWRVHGLGTSALLEAWAGELRVGEEVARRSLEIAHEANLQLHPATIDAYLAMAHVLREQNHLRRADRVLEEALARAGRARRSVALAFHAVERALWYLAASQPDEGLRLLVKFRTTADVRPPTTIETRMNAVEARLHLELADCERAEAVLDSNEGPWTADLAAVAVQVALALDDESAAKQRLADWPDGAELGPRLERELWSAIVESRYDNRRRAGERLADVLAIAEPEGHARLFIDAGPDAARLLRTLLRTTPTPYLRQLTERGAARLSSSPGAGDLASSLSARELAVVRYLPSRLSSAEIAGHLYISLNTLKTHLRSIYRKLGVDGRAEAIVKAKEEGIA